MYFLIFSKSTNHIIFIQYTEFSKFIKKKKKTNLGPENLAQKKGVVQAPKLLKSLFSQAVQKQSQI